MKMDWFVYKKRRKQQNSFLGYKCVQTDGDDPEGNTLTMPRVGAITSHICMKHLKQLLVVKIKILQ